MSFNRVAKSKAQRQDGNFVLLVVIVWEFDCSVEDGNKVCISDRLRGGIRTVALEAESISLGAQEVVDIAAMRSVASGTTLSEGRLMVYGLLFQVADVSVTAEADTHGISFWETGLVAGVRAVAISAITCCAGMRYLGGLNELGFIVVACDADCLGVSLGENDLAVLCRSMTEIAALGFEGRVHELDHQFGNCGLMGIVAFETVGRGEGLILMRLLQVSVLGVMTINTERRSWLGEVIFVFDGRLNASFVCSVACIAAHIKRGVTAAFLRDIHASLMAGEAKVFFFATILGLE